MFQPVKLQEDTSAGRTADLLVGALQPAAFIVVFC